MIITHKKYNSMPEQVQENMNNISKLNKQTVQTIKQELTDEEKAQVRENLGIIGQSKISSINFDYGEQSITYDTDDGITIHSNSLLTDEDQESYSFDSERNIPIISSEEIVFDATEDNKHIKAYLENTISNKINNSLQIPMSTPSEIKIVGVDTSKSQILINKSDLIQCNPNILINGNFQVNQRGLTILTGTTTGYMADRWRKGSVDSNITINNNNCSITIYSGSLGRVFSQIIEAYNLVGKKITASLNIINSNITTDYGTNLSIIFYNDTQYINTASMSLANKTGIITLTTEVPENTNRIVFSISSTSNSQIGENIIFNSPKLEIGSVATPFSPRPYAEELAICQRYYINFDGQSIGTTYPAYCNSSTVARFTIILPTTLRAQPTINLATGVSTMQLIVNGNSINPTNITFNSINNNCITYELTISGGATFQPAIVRLLQRFSLDAEIY